MPDMHRTGRIGGDVFDVNRLARADVAAAVIVTARQDETQFFGPGLIGQRQVDETRTRDIDARKECIGPQFLGNRLGELARFAAGAFGQHHRGVRSHIAMGSLAGRLDQYPRLIGTGGQEPRRDQFRIRRTHPIEHLGKQMVRRAFQVHPAIAYLLSGVPRASGRPRPVQGSSQNAAHVRSGHSDRSFRR